MNGPTERWKPKKAEPAPCQTSLHPSWRLPGLHLPPERSGTGKGRNAKRTKNEISFHSLRHTAVSLLKDAGIPEAVVMELVGHDSQQISAHYTHVGFPALERAAAALPEV